MAAEMVKCLDYPAIFGGSGLRPSASSGVGPSPSVFAFGSNLLRSPPSA